MNWTHYFETLQDWKKLPAYKAEPRVDSLLGHFLPEILRDLLGLEISALIPELPLRKGALREDLEGTVHAQLSWKVDFLAVGRDRNWLIEIKTDAGSRRKVQDQYLQDAVRVGTACVMAGIVQLSKASQAKAKYLHLLSRLHAAGILDDHNVWTGVNPTLEILYVQPYEPVVPERGIGFGRIADWLEARADAGEFEKAFAGALRGWSIG